MTESMKPIQVGLLGIGTVGSGTFNRSEIRGLRPDASFTGPFLGTSGSASFDSSWLMDLVRSSLTHAPTCTLTRDPLHAHCTLHTDRDAGTGPVRVGWSVAARGRGWTRGRSVAGRARASDPTDGPTPTGPT